MSSMFRYRRTYNSHKNKNNNNNTENGGVTYKFEKECDLIRGKDINNKLNLVKFGKNEGSADLLDKFDYLDILLADVKLLHSLFNKITEKTNKSFTSMDVCNLMNDILPKKFMKTDESSEEKLVTSALSWDKLFNTCSFLNKHNGEKDIFYIIGDMKLPSRVVKKTSREQYLQVNVNADKSSGIKTKEVYDEIQEIIMSNEKGAAEIKRMILEEANKNINGRQLRRDEEKKPVVNVVVINPTHNFEEDMLLELNENKNIHVIQDEEIYSTIVQYEYELASKREERIMNNMLKTTLDVAANEQKERKRREVQSQHSK